jgi:hypothetical protein
MIEFIGNPFEKTQKCQRCSTSFAGRANCKYCSQACKSAVNNERQLVKTKELHDVAIAYATKRKVPVSQILSEAMSLMFPNAEANAAMVESIKAQKGNLLPFRISKPKMQDSAVEVITPQYPSDCFLTINDENELVPVSTRTSLDNFPRPKNETEWFEAKKALPHAQKWLFIEMNTSSKGVQLGFYNEITKLVNIAQMYNTPQYFSCDLADLKRWAYVEIPTI